MDNADKALRYLEAAKHYRDNLDEEYQRARHDKAAIADLHHGIGFAFKAAEVRAQLAIADRLGEILDALRDKSTLDLDKAAPPKPLQIHCNCGLPGCPDAGGAA